jgi:hypothetical protein
MNINGATYEPLLHSTRTDWGTFDVEELDASIIFPGLEPLIERRLVGTTPEVIIGQSPDGPRVWIRADLRSEFLPGGVENNGTDQ